MPPAATPPPEQPATPQPPKQGNSGCLTLIGILVLLWFAGTVMEKMGCSSGSSSRSRSSSSSSSSSSACEAAALRTARDCCSRAGGYWTTRCEFSTQAEANALVQCIGSAPTPPGCD
jgi:hypothetical protein